MSRWTNPEEWARLCSGEACVICRQGVPHDVIAELESCWVTMGEESPMQGYCCLVFRRHAVELHDLTPDEGAAFMHDIQRVSRILQSLTGAVKLNYEVHGNTLPHLHMHLFPRYVGDAFEGGPINPRAVKGPVYAPGECEALKQRVRAALAG
ncbi:HIT family protein [Pyxidicoccus xibeiensis]|uniref:HIT family protein n=1 Tax=Pyxidicoccus xibeiensis TaxID=2906759 RepID=UPI0020A7D63F|nr:HIT family protein [Pyxidicoccus xibeiensis]MCP3139176.1 HIT family protein [Pyxidicoccus xibeiensis]